MPKRLGQSSISMALVTGPHGADGARDSHPHLRNEAGDVQESIATLAKPFAPFFLGGMMPRMQQQSQPRHLLLARLTADDQL